MKYFTKHTIFTAKYNKVLSIWLFRNRLYIHDQKFLCPETGQHENSGP